MSLEAKTLAPWYTLGPQSAKEIMNARYLHHRLTRLRQMFIVLTQTPVSSQPSEGAFHHPTHRQGRKTFLAFRLALHFQPIRSVMYPQPLVQIIVVILVVAEHDFQAGEVPAPHPRKHFRGRTAIIDVGRRHDHGDQKALHIDEDVPLAPPDFLAAIRAALRPPFGGLHRLAVDGGGTGSRVPTALAAELNAKGVEEALPSAVAGPRLEIVVHGLPGGEVMGQGPPAPAFADMVEQGVEDEAHGVLPRPAPGTSGRNQGLKQSPLLICKIAGIGFVSHALFYAPTPFWNRLLLTSYIFHRYARAGS